MVYEFRCVLRRTRRSTDAQVGGVEGGILRPAKRVTLECDQRHSPLFSSAILYGKKSRVCIWDHIADVI